MWPVRAVRSRDGGRAARRRCRGVEGAVGAREVGERAPHRIGRAAAVLRDHARSPRPCASRGRGRPSADRGSGSARAGRARCQARLRPTRGRRAAVRRSRSRSRRPADRGRRRRLEPARSAGRRDRLPLVRLACRRSSSDPRIGARRAGRPPQRQLRATPGPPTGSPRRRRQGDPRNASREPLAPRPPRRCLQRFARVISNRSQTMRLKSCPPAPPVRRCRAPRRVRRASAPGRPPGHGRCAARAPSSSPPRPPPVAAGRVDPAAPADRDRAVAGALVGFVRDPARAPRGEPYWNPASARAATPGRRPAAPGRRRAAAAPAPASGRRDDRARRSAGRRRAAPVAPDLRPGGQKTYGR